MVAQMDAEGFGHCSNHGECQAVCPKSIDTGFIARMNREWFGATVTARTALPPRKPRSGG
jgi:succinate dehydrogenase / fumarate reductase iron-sulfur subunit